MELELTDNGSTDWFEVTRPGIVNITGKNDFGGGTVAVQQLILNATESYVDDTGIPYTYTSVFDISLTLSVGQRIRLTLSGATSPTLRCGIYGPGLRKIQG
tara:strand:+ start:3481 stop:3783 length:303 start_codon:yes stop_codon:yes gene_type:complete